MEERIRIMLPLLDERQRRIFLAAEAKSYGFGGITAVSKLSGVAPYTIRQGLHEIENNGIVEPKKRVRASGAGRKKLQDTIPGIEDYIQEIVDGAAYGSSQKVLSYTTLSLRKIQDILADDFGINISFRSVSNILETLGYSKQARRSKSQAGEPNPDRNEQFEFINSKAIDFLEKGFPVVSVDMKKGENIVNCKNSELVYRKTKNAHKVLDYDLLIPELGKVAPYGLYVLNDNTGFVNLGKSDGTADSILRWWECVGQSTFPKADRIYINCDTGGGNASRSQLWQYELQQLANYTGLEIHVSHLPPGTTKWNKIGHQLFCYTSKTRAGESLIEIGSVVNLVSGTRATNELKVDCHVDRNKHELKHKVTDQALAGIQLIPCDTFGSWNYVVKPERQ